jgi:hypothetical protein
METWQVNITQTISSVRSKERSLFILISHETYKYIYKIVEIERKVRKKQRALLDDHEDGGDMILRSVGWLYKDYTLLKTEKL